MICNTFLSFVKTCRILKLQRFSTNSQSYSKKALQQKKSLCKKPKASLSEKFTDSMKLWTKLLGDDIEASFERASALFTNTAITEISEAERYGPIFVLTEMLVLLNRWNGLYAVEMLRGMIKNNVSWDIIESRGLCVGNLTQTGYRNDPMNGNIVTLHKEGLEKKKFLRRGTPVSICRMNDENILKQLGDGYITDVKPGKIEIKAMDDTFETSEGTTDLLLMRSTNLGALQNIRSLLTKTDILSNDSVHLANLAYRAVPMQSLHDRRLKSLPENLNKSQIAAVSAALNQRRNILCIQGPPGTGKTRVIAECVFHLIQNKKKVLVCAPTHVAVYNAYNATREKMMQVYSDEDIFKYVTSLSERNDEEFRSHSDYEKLVNMMQELKKTPKSLARYKSLSIEIIRHKLHILQSIYGPRRAIFSTLATSSIRKLPHYGFYADVIIVDEAAQSTEPSTWIPVLTTPTCKKLILVGDQKQLPAVVLSQSANIGGLGVSLMQKLEKEFQNCNVNILLNEQHRMNKKIMHWSNEVFYENQLRAHESVENITLNDFYPNLPHDHVLNSPIMMIDMDKKLGKTGESKDYLSFFNNDELEIVLQYVTRLVSEVGVEPSDIAIITPYSAQIEKIRERLPVSGIGVNTVDGFQGQERQIVIFCMVRDNSEGEIGFLKETRRLNVAVTRAKRQFILVGSSSSMKSNKDLKKLYRYLESESVVFGPDLLEKFDSVKLPNDQ